MRILILIALVAAAIGAVIRPLPVDKAFRPMKMAKFSQQHELDYVMYPGRAALIKAEAKEARRLELAILAAKERESKY